MDKLKLHTPDRAEENYRKLAALFPNAVTEAVTGYDEKGRAIVERAIDVDALEQEIAARVVEGQEERYRFTWPDKRRAILAANAPLHKTLRPCREESVDFDTTENLYIEGDNLEVLKLLRETYLSRVRTIYIDPPYNTGNDFLYEDAFAQSVSDYLPGSGQFDKRGNRLVQNLDSSGRFHTDWLNMIYPRLKLARDLLAEDGVIFISIDDKEQENLKKVCDEIFGERQFIGKIAVVNNLKGRNDRKDVATCHEYLLIYGKSEFSAGGMPLTEEQRQKFDQIDESGNPYQLRDLRKRGRPDRREDRPNMYFPIYYDEAARECSLEKHEGWVEIFPLRGDGSDGRWRWGRERVQENLSILEPHFSNIAGRWGIQHRVYLNPALNPAGGGDEEAGDAEERFSKSKSFWMGGELSSDVGRRQLKSLFGEAYFDYPKSVDFILNILHMGSEPDALVMDFFSGSATTAQAVMQLNATDGGRRKFIMVQWPEETGEKSAAYKAGYKTICEIGKERIRLAAAKIAAEHPEARIDGGFRVLKCDTSNMKDVYYTPEETRQDQLDLLADNIKEDRTPEDLLFQVMLDMGVPLSSSIEVTEAAGKRLFDVGHNYLLACFDANVTAEAVTEAAKRKPRYFVMRDSSIASDALAASFEQIFQSYSPDTVRKVL